MAKTQLLYEIYSSTISLVSPSLTWLKNVVQLDLGGTSDLKVGIVKLFIAIAMLKCPIQCNVCTYHPAPWSICEATENPNKLVWEPWNITPLSRSILNCIDGLLASITSSSEIIFSSHITLSSRRVQVNWVLRCFYSCSLLQSIPREGKPIKHSTI